MNSLSALLYLNTFASSETKGEWILVLGTITNKATESATSMTKHGHYGQVAEVEQVEAE